MKDQPLVSIALCTFNGQDFVEAQLNSILAQTYQNWELIVVDDASSDQTWTILQRYASTDSRFRLHCNDSNLGYNKNFEKALRLCQGEYIAICDQDDIWHPDKLQKQIARMDNQMLVYHDSEFIDDAGASMHRKVSDKFNFYRGRRPEPFLLMNCVSGHSIVFRKELLEHCLPFPADFHYDQWLAFNAAARGSVDFIEECLVSYRQHARNNTDMLALHAVKKDLSSKIIDLERESSWLLLCAGRVSGPTHDLIVRLYHLSIRRNEGFFSAAYGMLIWKHSNVLLTLLKKSQISKFFFTLRKSWGAQAKRIAK